MTIIENVKADLRSIGVADFYAGITCRYARYDLYLNDQDREVRRSALTAFTMMLGTWHTRSSFTFTPQHLRKFGGPFIDDIQWQELHHYVKAFVTYQHDIREDFPVMYAFIVWFFIHTEENKLLTYEEEFPELDAEWFARLREEVFQPNVAIERPSMKNFFSETGIAPFFESDFPEIETDKSENDYTN